MSGQALLYGGMAGLQLAGGYFAAQNIREAAAINKEIADMNAEFAELDAYDAEIAGISQVAQYQTVIDQVESEQNAIFAAQNVDASVGSAAAVVEESKFISELNKMEIEKQAEEVALGYNRQANDFRRSGVLGVAKGMQQAGDVMFNSAMQAANTGLTGYRRSR